MGIKKQNPFLHDIKPNKYTKIYGKIEPEKIHKTEHKVHDEDDLSKMFNTTNPGDYYEDLPLPIEYDVTSGYKSPREAESSLVVFKPLYTAQ